jgi:LacI family transcriptional regulator
MSEIVWPPLTTVRQPIQFFAEQAVRRLLEVRGESKARPRYEVVRHQLVVRESTAPPNKLRAA